jgi:hypothetical protein
MKFTEKNDYIVKYKSGKFFQQDYDLFIKHCPNSRLHGDLKKVNSFNKGILDGQMLFELLDKVSLKEILENREVKFIKPEEKVLETLDTVEAVSGFLKKESPNVEYSASVLESLIGKTEGEILNFISFGKLYQSEQSLDKGLPVEKLTEKEAELEEKEVELEDKEVELEVREKEVEQKAATSKKKASMKSSPK